MALITTFLVLLAIICSLILLKHKQKCLYWKRQNVETISLVHLVKRARKIHLYQVFHEIYQRMCSEQKPLQVIEALLVSAVLVQDQSAIKDVLTVQFENFPDRGLYVNQRDYLMANLGRFHYQVWKPLRKKLTPAFSPAKLRYIFPTMAQVGEQLVKVLALHVARGDQVLEIQDLCKRFAIDVIGTTAFGIECNCLKDPKSEFKVQCEKALGQHFRLFLDQFAEKYSSFLNLVNYKYHSTELRNFFTDLVKQTVEYREKNKIKRHDFMDMLIELKNEVGNGSEEMPLTMELVVGQVFLFFAAGYDSTATALCEALFELAKNPEIQVKARLEINQVMAQHGHKITYESLKQMKYTKQIILETLRKYPILHCLTRYCRHRCTLNTTAGPVTIPKETVVIIPTYGIHYNPEFYPNPQEFRPQRFEDQEMAKRPACTFLTFGEGPRGCMALGFGMMELMFGLSTLLSQFRFSVTEKTPKELEFDRSKVYHLSIQNNIYLKVETL